MPLMPVLLSPSPVATICGAQPPSSAALQVPWVLRSCCMCCSASSPAFPTHHSPAHIASLGWTQVWEPGLGVCMDAVLPSAMPAVPRSLCASHTNKPAQGQQVRSDPRRTLWVDTIQMPACPGYESAQAQCQCRVPCWPEEAVGSSATQLHRHQSPVHAETQAGERLPHTRPCC